MIDLQKLEEKLKNNILISLDKILVSDEIKAEIEIIWKEVLTGIRKKNDIDANALSHIFSMYAWALKSANQPREKITEFLNIAADFAPNTYSKSLCAYLKSSIFQEYSEFVTAEQSARDVLSLVANPLMIGHAQNALALALIGQGRYIEAEDILLEVLRKIEPYCQELNPVVKFVTMIEHDIKTRTEANLGELYTRMCKYEGALKLFLNIFNAKRDANRSIVEIAQAEIQVGDAYLNLKNYDSALQIFVSVENKYRNLPEHQIKSEQHLKALLGAASAAFELEKNIMAQEYLEKARKMLQDLKLPPHHSCSKKLEKLTQQCSNPELNKNQIQDLEPSFLLRFFTHPATRLMSIVLFLAGCITFMAAPAYVAVASTAILTGLGVSAIGLFAKINTQPRQEMHPLNSLNGLSKV